MRKIKLMWVQEIKCGDGSTAHAYYEVPSIVVRAVWVIASFALLMVVMFGGGYILHLISMDHWARFPAAMVVAVLTLGACGLLGYVCFKLTDELK